MIGGKPPNRPSVRMGDIWARILVFKGVRAWYIFILLLNVDAKHYIWVKSVTHELSKKYFSLTLT